MHKYEFLIEKQPPDNRRLNGLLEVFTDICLIVVLFVDTIDERTFLFFLADNLIVSAIFPYCLLVMFKFTVICFYEI